MSFTEALDAIRPDRQRPGHPRQTATRPVETGQEGTVQAMQTPEPRTAKAQADPHAAIVPVADDAAAQAAPATTDAADPQTDAPEPDQVPTALLAAAEPSAAVPQANGIAQPPAADQDARSADDSEEASAENDPADTERRGRRPGRAVPGAYAAGQAGAADSQKASGGDTANLAGRAEPQAAMAAGLAARTEGVAKPGETGDAAPAPAEADAAESGRRSSRRMPVSAPNPAGTAAKAATAPTEPGEPAPAGSTAAAGEDDTVPAALAGKASTREEPSPGPSVARAGDDADGEAAERVTPAAAAQAVRTGESAKSADDQGSADHKRQGTDGPEAFAGRRGRSDESKGRDREPGRHDAAADRTGAQAQAQPHPSKAAQAAAPVPAVAPGEAGPLNQFVPVVPTTGPHMMAAEVIQKVAAQAHAPGAAVPMHGLAIAVAARAAAGSTRFDIRLDPPELGRIEVQLILDREGSVRSRMVVEKQETLDLLQRDQRNLERALAQAGLDTKDGAIEFTLRDQGGHDRERHQPEQQHLWLPRGGREESPATPLPAAEIQSRLAALRGGIDIRI